MSGERKSLDAIEGEGGNYQRIEIEVFASNGLVEAMKVLTYVARERKKGLKTSAAYASEILNGLKCHQIPVDYLQGSIITWIIETVSYIETLAFFIGLTFLILKCTKLSFAGIKNRVSSNNI